MQLYGGALPNYDVEGNTAFYNGTIASQGATIDLLLGDDSGNVATSPIFLNNRTYSPMSQGADTTNIGFVSGCTNLTHNNNYYVGPTALALVNCTVSSMIGNTFYGATSGFSTSSYLGNTYYSSRPTGVQVFVQPDVYEPGRANITVYNWDGRSSVLADVSSVLSAGDAYKVLDAQYYHGAPVASGSYAGGSISIPVPGSNSPVDPAIGDVPVQPVHTPNEFGAFVLMKTGASAVTPPSITPPSTTPPVVTPPGPTPPGPTPPSPTPPAVTSPGITLSANPNPVSVVVGASASTTITATASGGATPSFSVSGVPLAVTATFSPSSCSGSCTTTLTFTATGTYLVYLAPVTVTVTATSDTLVATTPIEVIFTRGQP